MGVKHMDGYDRNSENRGGFGHSGGRDGPRFGGGFGGRPQGDRFSPVKVGEELDVAIEAVGEKGDGIAKKKGFVLFVPNVKQGDNVRIRVTKVFKKVGFAEVIGEATGKPEESSEEAPQEEQQQESEAEEKPQDSEDF